ncbi:hypothetical protein GCM10027062_36300 [Nocardioides hungaricus]
MLHALATAALTLAALVAPAPPPDPPQPRVLAISVDGLNVGAIRQLGPAGAPSLYRLLDEGAGTLNARTEYEQSVTLPNHTSMLTGRRITARYGGHGVTWDDDRPGTTVQQAAGRPIASVFTEVRAAGGDTALYSTKDKFSLYQRSWPRSVDTFETNENQRRLVRMARADLRDGAPTFTFLHVSLPDRAGHEFGGLSEQYVAAVRRTDTQLGTLLRAVARSPVTVVLTADHGFSPGAPSHSDRTDPANYTIPFLVWGAGVEAGDLYALNPGYRDPGGRRPSYAPRRQPVRNGDLANLAAGLLGLDRVPGSRFGAARPLVVGP